MRIFFVHRSKNVPAETDKIYVCILRSKCGRTPEMLSLYAYILRSSQQDERRIYAYEESISGVRPHLERRIYTTCLFLPAHSCCDERRIYAYINNIPSLATIDILRSK